MNRRTALKIATGGLIGGGAGIFILTNAFKPEVPLSGESKKLELKAAESDWKYHQLDPAETAGLAYIAYGKGSCMYAVVHSFISQLAAKFGEPYASFPSHMMIYGHGGIGGFGTICGALNGAAALIGLFVPDKSTQDALIKDLYQWYAMTPLPEFIPDTAVLDFTPPVSVSESTLCHVSMTCWGKASGCRVKSKQRKERCRRLTGDVAAKLAAMMNQFTGNTYATDGHDEKTTQTCLTCHGQEGKLGNTGGKMSCTSCHDESLGHGLFADLHYKLMNKKE
jgi:hypothetical protein